MYHYRSGPLNLSESTKYLIVALIIYVFSTWVYFWSPNSNILAKAQSLRSLILVVLPRTSFMLFKRVERIFEKWYGSEVRNVIQLQGCNYIKG